MNDKSSSGGRGPSSIKPPTIKPPTARDDAFGATTLGAAPRATMPLSAPSSPVGAMPQHASAPLTTAQPRPQQNLLLWIVGGVLILGLLVVALAVVLYLWLR
jgi:hypothetical protein